MKDILIKKGRVVDPSNNIDKVADVLISQGKIARVAESIDVKECLDPEDVEIIDATGKIVMPGFIDMHVHLREPGFEEKEDIESGTRAAAMGGFTAVACMPNVDPPCDNDSVVASILKRAQEVGRVKVYPIGAVTKGRKGQELAEMGEMKRKGAVAFSDDGSPVANAEVLRCALEYLKTFDATLIDHPEDKSLSEGGQMNLGLSSTLAGLRGIPAEAEEIAVIRDILVCQLTSGRLHLAHISTEGSCEFVRWAKSRGLRVTCEVTPHHLLLTDDLVLSSGYDTNTKVNPPLRTRKDIDALVSALKDGTIDAIATDHAPHQEDDKWVEYDYAAQGISGLETAVSLMIDRFVRPGVISWMTLSRLMSQNPARILGVPGGSLSVGAPGDVTIVDPEYEFAVDPRQFQSKGKNTPFAGWRLVGAPWATIVDGKIVMKDRSLV